MTPQFSITIWAKMHAWPKLPRYDLSPYNVLTAPAESVPAFYTQKGNHDLGKTLKNTDWTAIWKTALSCSQSKLVVESNYKVHSKWYLVPNRIATYSSDYWPLCFHGCKQIG